LKELDNKDFKILNYKKPSFVVDCQYSKIVNNLLNKQISNEVDLDKSIKHIINTVAIGQLEKGSNRVQSSSIFHTLEEARGYQTLNGGTLNIITKASESTTVDIVESCPEINKVEHLDTYTHRLRDKSENPIKHGMRYINRIYGPMRITYDKYSITDEIILKSKIKKLDNLRYEHLAVLNNILNNENTKQHITKETKQKTKDINYENNKEINKEQIKKQRRIRLRNNRNRTKEEIQLYNEWIKQKNIYIYIYNNRVDKPTDFKTYKGRMFNSFDSDIESSDGEDTLSDVSDFSDSSDDEELTDNVVKHESEK
jgi:hypothetical protein